MVLQRQLSDGGDRGPGIEGPARQLHENTSEGRGEGKVPGVQEETPFARRRRTTSGKTSVEVSPEWRRKLAHDKHPRKRNAPSPAGDARWTASLGIPVGRIHR